MPGLKAATGASDLSSTDITQEARQRERETTQQQTIQCQAHHHMTLAFVYYLGRRERLSFPSPTLQRRFLPLCQ